MNIADKSVPIVLLSLITGRVEESTARSLLPVPGHYTWYNPGMQLKQGIILAAVCLVVGSVGIVWYCLHRPSPLQSAYNRVTLGMSEADVERLVPDVREPADQGGMLEYVEWTGWVQGRPVQVRTPREPVAADNPALANSLYVHMEDLGVEEVDKTRFVLKDPASGEVVGSVRTWTGEKERLSVLFNQTGVVEKVYIKVQ